MFSMSPIGNVLAEETNALGTYYYRVTNVDQSDVLNLRDEPAENSSITGSIPWDESLVMITKLSQDGKWGLVPSDGDNWVNMKYLEPIDLELLHKPVANPANPANPLIQGTLAGFDSYAET